jgi:DNA-binding CsgD family transcriptional regulator
MTQTTTINADRSDDHVPARPDITAAPASFRPRTEDSPALTAAEHAVLRWIAAGRSNAQIGQCLFLREKAVRNQVTRIYAKLGVANRAERVAVHVHMQFVGVSGSERRSAGGTPCGPKHIRPIGVGSTIA